MADVFRFDGFEFDLRSRELRRNGSGVALQEQPLRILEMLVKADGAVVPREELIAALWPAGTFVDFERGLNTAVNKLRVALGDSAESPRFIETVGRRGYRFIPRPARIGSITIATAIAFVAILVIIGFASRRSKAAIRSIAVLPLANLSSDQQQEFFADGMTDQLITDLAQIRGVGVISRRSVMQFKASHLPLPEIGRRLGVDAVVEGSVIRNGSRVRVTAQLLDVRTDRHLWASDYEREVGDIFSLQKEIARDIADHVGAKLTAAASPRPPVKSAYLLYLRGRYEWNRFPPNFGAAIGFFEQAIREDPRYALAYAGLADCYATRNGWETLRSPNDAAIARSLALKAIQIDPTLAEPYATLAGLDEGDFDFRAAGQNYRRAIAANPNYVVAHQWYALHLIRLRRFDDAIREARIAQQLDPVSIYANNALALALMFGGRNAEALERTRIELQLYPSSDPGGLHFRMSLLLHALGRDAQALDEFIASLDDPKVASIAQRLRMSRPPYVDAVRLYLDDPASAQPDGYWETAVLWSIVGDREKTLQYLKSSYAHGESPVRMMNAEPRFEFIRDDPRFQDLVGRMHLNGSR
jgi:TolB-like protein